MARGAIHLVCSDVARRQLLTRHFRTAGHVVKPYDSAQPFLAAAGPALVGCVVLDLRLPDMSGLEVQRRIKIQGCRLPVVFLTSDADLAACVRAMKQGAVDFLLSTAPAGTVLAAISEALLMPEERGERREAELRARAASLTERQKAVWLAVARGRLNKEIAADLGLVERTVKLHRANAMAILGANSTAELARLAERLRLIDSERRRDE